MKRIYNVWQNMDSIEGRGPMVMVATYEKRDHAEFHVQHGTRDMGGSPCCEIREAWMVEAGDNPAELKHRQLVESAEGKLTTDEMSALMVEFGRMKSLKGK